MKRSMVVWWLALAVVLVGAALLLGNTRSNDCKRRGGTYGPSPYADRDNGPMVCLSPDGKIIRTY